MRYVAHAPLTVLLATTGLETAELALTLLL